MSNYPGNSASATQVIFMVIYTPACLLLSPFPATFAQEKPSSESLIQVEVSGLRNEKGKVLCALYSSPDGFPKKDDKASAHVTADISERHAACRFSGVTPATYAVSVFHDENSNRKLDTNFMGIPSEGVGASNNAKGHFGPPNSMLPPFTSRGADSI